MKQVTILDCPFHQITFKGAIQTLEAYIQQRTTHQIVVVNAAKLVKMRKDAQLKKIITSCDLIGVDGVPVIWAGRLLGQHLPERLNGTDLMDALIELSAEKNYRLYFFGATEAVLSRAIENVKQKYPKANIVGWRNGYFIPEQEAKIVADINEAQPDILFVGMGTPMKEYWIHKHRKTLKVPVIHGVGGSIDVLAGHTNRAPVWMQKTGLEWFFRLLQEPSRMWKRYLGTNSQFIMLVLLEFFKKKFSPKKLFTLKSKIMWIIFRLKTMSGQEVVYRFQQQAFAFWEFTLFHRAPKIKTSHMPVRLNPFFISSQMDLTFFEANPELKNEILQQADRVCEHRFSIFEVKDADFGYPLNWHYDHATGRQWPLKFYRRLSYRSTGAGSSKWIMELNRHQHFFWLGQAYLITKYAGYADEILDQMSGWIDQNSYLKGIHWYSGLEMALRLISWGWALNILTEYEGLTEKILTPILNSLYAQAHFIERHQVRHSSANNHLIGEATGLLVASIIFESTPPASSWFEKSRLTLEEEIRKQILQDGMNAEQSTHYLMFILEFFLLASSLLTRKGKVLPESFKERLESAAAVLYQLREKNGTLPAIGDGDNGIVYFPKTGIDRIDSVLNSIGILCDRPDLCAGKWENDVATFWWWSWHANYARFNLNNTGSQPAPSDSRHYRDAGYFLMQNSKTKQKLLFDYGPLGFPPMAAHGHADALSIYMTEKDEPILIDPGTYFYYDQIKLKHYLRGTRSHNTITVDDKDQSEIVSYFVWRNQAKVKLINSITTPEFDFIVAEHDGYERLTFPVIHQRQILNLKKHYWLIVDYCYGGYASHSFEQNFHFAPDGQLGLAGRHFSFSKNGMRLKIIPMDEEQISKRIYHGSMEPVHGWYSPRFHEIQSTSTLSFRKKDHPPTVLGAVLVPAHSADAIESVQRFKIQTFECFDYSRLVGIKLQHSAGMDYFFSSPAKETQVKFADFYFHGQLIWLRQLKNGEVAQIYGMNMKRLNTPKIDLFAADDYQNVVSINYIAKYDK